MSCAVVFGGSGFIGCFFADLLLTNGAVEKVYLFDLESPTEKPFEFRRQLLAKHAEAVVFIRGDVRAPIELVPSEAVSLVANFAAVHREPGHEDHEYFETNLLGAENVTAWAERVECENLIFTSSISPYGVSESVKDERTIPVPVTAYGASKLAAEKIHIAWQKGCSAQRKLTIVRPGVVFGPGEGGNVTRLVRAVRKGYFFYMGNRSTRKAGIYVKELCSALWWIHDRQQRGLLDPLVVFNGSMNPSPSISEYVSACCKVSGIKRHIPSVPYPLLMATAYAATFILAPFGVKHPFSPVRVRKLVRSNNILPSFLVNAGYEYKYDLESAMEDWAREFPEDWLLNPLSSEGSN